MMGKLKGTNKKLQNILETLMSHPFALDFLRTNPSEQNNGKNQQKVDLLTIKERLHSGSYKDHDDFFNDVKQIWKNCQFYNQDVEVANQNCQIEISQHQKYQNSFTMEKLSNSLKLIFEKELEINKEAKTKKNTNKDNEQSDSRFKKNPNEGYQMLRFSYNLKNIQDEDHVVHLINMLAEYCPYALKIVNDDMQIDLKYVDPSICELIGHKLQKMT